MLCCSEDTPALLGTALGLTEPWHVVDVSLDPAAKRLEIRLDFRRGGTFACPECGATGCPAHDTEERCGRHLDFFQFRTELIARMPLIGCEHCGVLRVEVPWARTGSGFTLRFEAWVLAMAPHLPMPALTRLVGEHDTRLCRLVRHHVEEARAVRTDARVKLFGLD